MVSIEYSLEALVDVEHIFQTILRDKPNAASEYISKLEKCIDLLEFNKEMGVKCKHRSVNFDCRILVFEQYKIFYQLNDEEVYILRIIHSKQSMKKKKF